MDNTEKLLRALIVLLAITLTGCNPVQKNNRVVCDSGFKTPWSKYAHIDMNTGLIEWNNGVSYKRMMANGEICHREKKQVQEDK